MYGEIFWNFYFKFKISRLTRSRRYTLYDNVMYARNISLSLFDERWRPAERSKPSRGLTSLGWRRSLLFSVVVASFDEQLFPSRCGQIAQKLPFSLFTVLERERKSLPSSGSVHRDTDKIRSTTLPIRSIHLSLSLFLSCHFSSPIFLLFFYASRQFGEARATTKAFVTFF